MCGIAGFFRFRSNAPADPAVLRSMVATLRHRGPDEDGLWTEGSTALGMRRLRVIDPLGGSQPIVSEDGAVRVVFNGEIYNHRELRGLLEAHGHTFRTRSDTEVIVHAYEEWGEACPERFNGMFAFALWDDRAKRLVVARDRLGIKPLYVHEGPDGVVFGSELKAVLRAPWVPLNWDLCAIEEFLTYEYVPGPATILADVRKLEPGTVATWDAAGHTNRRAFWVLERGDSPPTPEAAAAGLRERLEAAVERRLIADVPLGAFLSGGLDSTVIVGIMSQLVDGVRTFSIGFDDPSYDELPFARVAAERFGTHHREEVIRPDAVAMAEELSDIFDEPFGDVSSFPTFLVSRLARKDVTVVLSGDGGDELLAGYDTYRAQRFARRFGPLLSQTSGRALHGMLRHLPPGDAKKGLRNAAKRFAEGLTHPTDLEHARWFLFWDTADRRRLFTDATLEAVADHDRYGFYRARLAEARDRGFRGLERQLYADVTGYLPEDILVKVDRMSMGVSLEARVPFLDHEVVEYAMNIPGAWKLRGRESKWILKRAFADLLPPTIRNRKKEGFSIPMKHWLRGPLEPMMRDLLSAGRVRDRGWFSPDAVSALVAEHASGRHNHAHRLWCLMSLEMSASNLTKRATSSPSLPLSRNLA